MKTFKMYGIQLKAQKQKEQALNVASAQKAIDVLKSDPDLMHACQVVAEGSRSFGASVNKSFNAVVNGDAVRRGIDERATRTAAATWDFLTCPHGVPVQVFPPLTQLLNTINSGTTPDAVNNDGADAAKKEANGHRDVEASEEDESPFEFWALETALEAISSFLAAHTTELETAYPALYQLMS